VQTPRKALPIRRRVHSIMLSFSTAALVSALALCSALTGLVHATGPRTQCIGTFFISTFGRSTRELTGRSTPYRKVSHPVSPCSVSLPTSTFADRTAPRTQAKRYLRHDREPGRNEPVCDSVHEPWSKLYVPRERIVPHSTVREFRRSKLTSEAPVSRRHYRQQRHPHPG